MQEQFAYPYIWQTVLQHILLIDTLFKKTHWGWPSFNCSDQSASFQGTTVSYRHGLGVTTARKRLSLVVVMVEVWTQVWIHQQVVCLPYSLFYTQLRFCPVSIDSSIVVIIILSFMTLHECPDISNVKSGRECECQCLLDTASDTFMCWIFAFTPTWTHKAKFASIHVFSLTWNVI